MTPQDCLSLCTSLRRQTGKRKGCTHENALKDELTELLRAVSVIEAESELIEITRQVFSADPAVGSSQPSLEVREDHVAERENLRSARSIEPLDDPFVANALPSQGAIAVETVGPQRRPLRLD